MDHPTYAELSLLADPLNIMILLTAAAGIMTLLWSFVHGAGPIMVINLIYGYALFGTGSRRDVYTI